LAKSNRKEVLLWNKGKLVRVLQLTDCSNFGGCVPYVVLDPHYSNLCKRSRNPEFQQRICRHETTREKQCKTSFYFFSEIVLQLPFDHFSAIPSGRLLLILTVTRSFHPFSEIYSSSNFLSLSALYSSNLKWRVMHSPIPSDPTLINL
jgi:hypothetical protein